MVPTHTHDWLVELHPGAEDKGLLVSILMVLNRYISPSGSLTFLVSVFPPCHMLPHLCLHLYLRHRSTHRLPQTLQVQASLFPPSPCYARSRTTLRPQTQLQFCTSHNILVDGVLVEEDY